MNINIDAQASRGDAAPAPTAATPAPLMPSSSRTPAEVSAQEAEIAALRKQLDDNNATKAIEAERENKITAKAALGLSRPQAIAAIRRQEQFDASDYGKFVRARHESRQSRLR